MDTKDIYLRHYYHASNEPLKSITQLPEKEALALAKKLRDELPCGAHGRFGPVFDEAFVEYYRGRKVVEKQLHERFIALGGKPQVTAPYYLFVQDWGQTFAGAFMDDDGNDNERIVEIGLHDIDICDVSFVFDDSMAVVNSCEWDGLFLKDALMEGITLHNSYENYLNSLMPPCNHIEAQLWTDKYHHLLRTK